MTSTTARPTARMGRRNGRTRYAVGPDPRRFLVALAVIATMVAGVLALGAAGRSDMRRECANTMPGTDHAATIRTCTDLFGPNGY